MLLPCPACHRHVRSGASACPFCEAPLDGAARPDDAPDTRGWKRAAIFTFGAALSLTACSSTATGSDAAPQDSATDTAPMDAPLTDTSPTDTSPTDASRTDVVTDTAVDNGGIAPPYGIAPTDAGPPDDGSFKADYGAPPPRDAGTD